MDRRPRRWVLPVQAILVGLAGLALFIWPREVATAWPWALPSLAARFVGAAFLGIAAATTTIALWREPRGLRALAAMSVGTLLVPLAAIITPETEVDLAKLVVLTVLLGAMIVADVSLLRGTGPGRGWGPLSRTFLAYFAIHLALVVPIGLALYIAPSAMSSLSPWPLSVINTRLLAGVVLASAPLSALALRERDWAAVYPTAFSHFVFVTLATVAMAMHFGIYDASRLRTWGFVGLYVVAAVVTAAAVVRATQAWRAART